MPGRKDVWSSTVPGHSCQGRDPPGLCGNSLLVLGPFPYTFLIFSSLPDIFRWLFYAPQSWRKSNWVTRVLWKYLVCVPYGGSEHWTCSWLSRRWLSKTGLQLVLLSKILRSWYSHGTHLWFLSCLPFYLLPIAYSLFLCMFADSWYCFLFLGEKL